LVARQETNGYPSLLEYLAYHAQDCKYVNLNGYGRKVDAVIGQEKTLFKLLLAAIQPKSFCLEGPAGSGKTLMMYSLLSLLPSEDVYLFEMSTDTVLFLHADEINKRKILFIPEYQKVVGNGGRKTQEALKALLEGRPAIHRERRGKRVIEYRIEPIYVFTAIASENRLKGQVDKDKEDRRRYALIKVDASAEQMKKVSMFKARNRFDKRRNYVSEEIIEALERHIARLMNLQFEVFDPFAEYIAGQIPDISSAACYIDEYFDFVAACTKYHFLDRRIESDGRKYLFTNLQDHFLVWWAYKDDFFDALSLLEGKEIRVPKIDWEECWRFGIENMKRAFPYCVVDEWIKKQLRCGKVVAPDLENKSDFVIVDYAR